MEMAYRYVARASNGNAVEGVVFADSLEMATIKVRQIGHKPVELAWDLKGSVNAFLHKEFNEKDLARFYLSLGKKIEKGGSLIEGVTQAMDFVNDTKLLTALGTMRDTLMDGATIGNAMAMAGFPQRDVAAVAALDNIGKASRVFQTMGEETRRRLRLRQMLRKTLSTPKFFMGIVFVLTYGSVAWAAPQIKKLLSGTPKLDLPSYAKAYYAMSDVVNQHIVLASVLYLLLGIGAVWFTHTDAFRRLTNQLPNLKRLSERTDLASLWGSYGLLFQSGMNYAKAAKLISKAAVRPESSQWFNEFGNLLDAGVPIEEAVRRAGFPRYICNAIAAAASGNELDKGMNQLASDLMEEVEELSERLARNMDNWFKIVMGLVLIGFFFISYYPILLANMSQL